MHEAWVSAGEIIERPKSKTLFLAGQVQVVLGRKYISILYWVVLYCGLLQSNALYYTLLWTGTAL